jgi:hypothetical protein
VETAEWIVQKDQIRDMPKKRYSRADVDSVVTVTGLDDIVAASLLDASNGDIEMAISLHFGGLEAGKCVISRTA